MTYSVTPCSFESIRQTWKDLLPRAATNTIFLTPCWQNIWWKHFGDGREPLYLRVHCGDQVVGVAPLMLEGDTLALAGSTEVCDYLDFILEEEHCSSALPALFDYIGRMSWSTLVLHSIPGKSPTSAFLRDLAARGDARYLVDIQQEDVSPGVELPGDWESYLSLLSKKDRHELRRKFRRLAGVGSVQYVATTEDSDLEHDLDDFFRLHRDSREDKAAFMTPSKEAFFREIARAFVAKDIGKLFRLEVDGIPAASVLCFDYNNERLLYNSGFDHSFSSLSVGLLLKAYTLRDAIEAGMRRFDFLRGDEPYKYDLGGVDAPMYQCTIQRR